MKRQKTVIIKFLFAAILIMSSLGNANAQDNATLTIGNQNWMVKNLDVSTYRNGDSIPEVQDSTDWANLKTGAWCYYNNNSDHGSTHGKLYNWFAVNDQRGLAPAGYHIPSDEEWNTIINYLGGTNSAGAKMKNTSGWVEGNGTNSSGFTGLPSGGRTGYGGFVRMGGYGRWWSSTRNGNSATLLMLHYFSGSISKYGFDVRCGYSVRCLKDNNI
jgi:uncharacterized protein (TIGR02145 family)